MSTISTQLNWGASYLVNDLYGRFYRKDASDKELVRVSRLATGFLMVASLLVTSAMTSIEGAWRFLLAIGAGTGLVLILRWYWWRINAWSEISAMLASLVVSLYLWFWAGLDPDEPSQWATIMIATVVSSTVVWLAVTFLTQPERHEVLERFYRKVRPGGLGWRAVSARLGYGKEGVDGGPLNWTNWVAGVTAVYSSLFGVGKFILAEYTDAWIFLGIAIVSFAWIAVSLRDMPPDRVLDEPSR
jgi:Na+/proline symporter